MHKPIKILTDFNKEELKRFRKFLESELYTEKKLLNFYDYVIKHYPDFKDVKSIDEKYTSKVKKRAREKKDTSTIRNLYSDLLKALKLFYSLDLFIKDEVQMEYYLFKKLLDKKHYNLLNKLFLKSKKRKRNNKIFKTENYHSKYLNDWLFYESNFFENAPATKSNLEEKNNCMYQLHRNLFYYYFLNSLNAYSSTINNCYLMNKKIQSTDLGNFFDAFFPLERIELILKENYLNNSKIENEIFEMRLLHLKVLLKINLSEDIFRFYSLFKKNWKKLSVEDCASYSTITSKLPTDDSKFDKLRFEFYTLYFDNKMYQDINNRFMETRDFNYYLVMAIRAKNFKWAKWLLKKHIRAIIPENREKIFNLYYAKYYTEQKDYALAEKYFTEINYFSDAQMNLLCRVLQFVIYYEQKSFENCLSLLNAFESYLRKKEIPKEYSRVYRNFLRFTKPLLNFKLNYGKRNKMNLEILLENLQKGAEIPEKKWLLEKYQSELQFISN
ncbi:MAG: hypothetical protein K1X86_02195 [Ignavibacteria bacterium]|nr:hypothetical protein [Ignavibacteria bacterium]